MMNNKVSLKQIISLIDSSEIQEHIFWDKELVVNYRLPCGFTVLGRAACVDPKNFDLDIGRDVARKNAIEQLWELEGYRLQLKLAGESF